MRHLHGGAVNQVANKDVVALDVGHTLAIGREGGDFLAAAVAQGLHRPILEVIDVVVGTEAVTIDFLRVVPQQDIGTVGGDFKIVPARHLLVTGIDQDALVALGVTDAHDGVAVVAQAVKVAAIALGGLHGTDATGRAAAQHTFLKG